MSICQDLPEIQIIRHARAKHLRLRVYTDTIRLTVPLLCGRQQIDQFLKQSETWLVETWQKQHQLREVQPQDLPSHLQLFDLELAVQVEYVAQKKPFRYLSEHNLVQIDQDNAEISLKAFIIFYAKHKLPHYLAELSRNYGLPYAKCNIRHPKTRWGSCSSQHDIMLNAALVLYPQTVVHYVCVHELAHTRFFDHSAAFWSEVAKYDVNFKLHRKTLKTTALPYWWQYSIKNVNF